MKDAKARAAVSTLADIVVVATATARSHHYMLAVRIGARLILLPAVLTPGGVRVAKGAAHVEVAATLRRVARK